MSNQINYDKLYENLEQSKKIIDALAEIYKQQSEYKAKIENLEKEIDRILNNINEIQKMYTNIHTSNTSFKDKIVSKAEKKIQELYTKISLLEDSINKLSSNISISITNAEKRLQEVEKKLASIDTINTLYNSQKKFEEGMWTRFNNLSKTTSKLEAELETAKNEILNIKVEFNSMKKVSFKNKKQTILIITTLTGSGSIIYLIIQKLLDHFLR